MRDAAVDDAQSNSVLLDGEIPRLGDVARPVPQPQLEIATDAVPAAPPVAPATGFAPPSVGMTPVIAPDLSAPDVSSPVMPAMPALPSLPATGSTSRVTEPLSAPEGSGGVGSSSCATATRPSAPLSDLDAQPDVVEAAVEAPRHPMAHLMPEKSAPSEASLRAAQARAAKKAKARRIKIITSIVLLAIAALVGPPLLSWLADAVNDAGTVQTDEPTDVQTDEPTVTVAVDSSVPAPGGLAGVAALPDEAQDVVDQTNAGVTDSSSVTSAP